MLIHHTNSVAFQKHIRHNSAYGVCYEFIIRKNLETPLAIANNGEWEMSPAKMGNHCSDDQHLQLVMPVLQDRQQNSFASKENDDFGRL
jgi:hypothetical protein